MNRAVVAFVIAPLTAPAVVGSLGVLSAVMHSFDPIEVRNPFPDAPMIIYVTVIAAAFSYGGAIVFGIPGYLWLRKRGTNAFWAWPALGFGVGAATALVLFLWALVKMQMDPNVDHSRPMPEVPGIIVVCLLLAGSFGALVGTVHRLIAPPRKRVLGEKV